MGLINEKKKIANSLLLRQCNMIPIGAAMAIDNGLKIDIYIYIYIEAPSKSQSKQRLLGGSPFRQHIKHIKHIKGMPSVNLKPKRRRENHPFHAYNRIKKNEANEIEIS
jgi:hypothetical protein